MNIRIVVGDVELQVDGADLSKSDITRLLNRVAAVHADMDQTVDIGDLLSGVFDKPTDDDETPEPDGTGTALDAHVTLSADDAPLFGFRRWMPEDPEWVPEEAP